jgi:hypothetical protein
VRRTREMTVNDRESPRQDLREAEPVRDKAPWSTPRLTVQGTVTVKTLAATGPVQPSA